MGLYNRSKSSRINHNPLEFSPIWPPSVLTKAQDDAPRNEAKTVLELLIEQLLAPVVPSYTQRKLGLNSSLPRSEAAKCDIGRRILHGQDRSQQGLESMTRCLT